jgi:hypothetical protein
MCDSSVIYESPFSNTDCNQLCSGVGVLVTGNTAAAGNGPIQTYDFDTATLITAFVPDGAIRYNQTPNGRGIAIYGMEIFYTELSGDGAGPSDGIHVAPYGTKGSGGADTRTLPNPRPAAGIQDLAFHGNVLYVLSGYPDETLQVQKLDPATGSVIGAPISIGSPAQDDSDGFTVLPNGNFLINDFDGASDGAPIYREYDGTTGQLVSGGLLIDLSAFGFSHGTGVAIAPDEQSLYFMADFNTLVQTDLAGNLIATRNIGNTGYEEDIDVVAP